MGSDRNCARRDLCGGLSVMGVPTAIAFSKYGHRHLRFITAPLLFNFSGLGD